MWNEDYPNDEAFLFAIADAMHGEYKAIVDAGFLLQIDDPDLPDAWQIHSDMSVPEYRKFAELRVDALNHTLRDIPPDCMRLNVCWGSYPGPQWEDVKLPEGKVLIPGVVGHASNFIEHPELVAERLVKYARLVDRENVIAGTVAAAVFMHIRPDHTASLAITRTILPCFSRLLRWTERKKRECGMVSALVAKGTM